MASREVETLSLRHKVGANYLCFGTDALAHQRE